MTNAARFDFVMDVDEKEVISRAASVYGVKMATFVRMAAKEKAYVVLDRESRVTMSEQDFKKLTAALNRDFSPNLNLQRAMSKARAIKRA